ncbi:MAG: hypothetical protein E6H78_15165, partial [Betaproteobacteria bacterium]
MLDRILGQRQHHHRRHRVCEQAHGDVDAEREALSHADLLNAQEGFDQSCVASERRFAVPHPRQGNFEIAHEVFEHLSAGRMIL